jgi:hypothetical protein
MHDRRIEPITLSGSVARLILLAKKIGVKIHSPFLKERVGGGV